MPETALLESSFTVAVKVTLVLGSAYTSSKTTLRLSLLLIIKVALPVASLKLLFFSTLAEMLNSLPEREGISATSLATPSLATASPI